MHDYDIAWDYMLDTEVKKEHLTILNKIIKDIKKNDLHKLNTCKDFSVHCVILENDGLGVYCMGTFENPVIGIDIDNILNACNEYNADFNIALKTTILHELKHSWQEWFDKPMNEEEAEDFAFQNS